MASTLGPDEGSGSEPPVPTPLRLDKALARSGAGSRRACGKLVVAGRVRVDGRVVTNPLAPVSPATSEITLDGTALHPATDLTYLVVHKPPGVVCAMHDPDGRPCLGDLLGPDRPGLFHVSRLDVDTSGVQILMNDGQLAARLTAHCAPRTYLAQLRGPVPPGLERRLLDGVEVDGTRVRADSFRSVVDSPRTSLVEIGLHETVKRGARRLLVALHDPPVRMVCVRVGPVTLGSLEVGQVRDLSREEVCALRAMAEGDQGPGAPGSDSSAEVGAPDGQ
ncbi:pseudouridine synthase [Nocardioides ferulae]|uniref:pseudouridine synthase n=1 Tax=Nocardioides ferulae TaxID=2340821 RepID=UPI000EB021EA|nr:pseudouridine synthase [Nocardioides ferulae]